MTVDNRETATHRFARLSGSLYRVPQFTKNHQTERAGQFALAFLWLLALVQVATLHDNTVFVLFERWSPDHIALFAAFLGTTVAMLLRPRARVPVAFHLLLVAVLIIRHPMGAVLERDGFLALFIVYLLAVVHLRTRIAARSKLLIGTSLLAVVILETGLSVRLAQPEWMNLPDYDAVLREDLSGALLKPNLDLDVVGDGGPARFVTNQFGFRNRLEPLASKPSNSFRALFVGDSFVVGYRTDQEHTAGHLLAQRLTQYGRKTEVWLVGAGHPEAAVHVIEDHALQFTPDLVLVGITIGNDVASAYATHNGLLLEEGPLASLYLPKDAYKPTWWSTLPLRAYRSLHAWRIHDLLRRVLRPEGIGSWFRDTPGEVHLFDGIHSLGLFYSRRSVPEVVAAWSSLGQYMSQVSDICAATAVECIFVAFPQRFQVAERELRATLFDYALDPVALDSNLASVNFANVCRQFSLECLDLKKGFESEPGSYYLPGGDMHWNEAGHKLAAELIATHLVESPRLAEHLRLPR